MLYREIMTVCSDILNQHTNTMCGQNVVFYNVKPGGTYSNHYALKRYYFSFSPFKCFDENFVCI